MSLLTGALGWGRQQARARMTETVMAGLFTAGVDSEGAPTRVLMEERYTGAARVKYPSLTVSESDATGQFVASQNIMLSLPAGSLPLLKGDEVLVSASSVDGSLVGRVYRVEAPAQAGQTTAHRYPVVEVSGG